MGGRGLDHVCNFDSKKGGKDSQLTFGLLISISPFFPPSHSRVVVVARGTVTWTSVESSLQDRSDSSPSPTFSERGEGEEMSGRRLGLLLAGALRRSLPLASEAAASGVAGALSPARLRHGLAGGSLLPRTSSVWGVRGISLDALRPGDR